MVPFHLGLKNYPEGYKALRVLQAIKAPSPGINGNERRELKEMSESPRTASTPLSSLVGDISGPSAPYLLV